MTLIVSVKVNEGVVLAADSATSMSLAYPNGQPNIVNVYNNGNKLFNLYKGVRIGALTFGTGSIGKASMYSLSKDFRNRISDISDPLYVDPSNYKLVDVAAAYIKFMADAYTAAYPMGQIQPPLDSFTGFLVAGYSSGGSEAEHYVVALRNGIAEGPVLVPGDIYSNGQPEAVERLILGFSTRIAQVLEVNVGVPPDQIQPLIQVLTQSLYTPLVNPAMPIQDAIDLAEFLVHTTIQYIRFSEGHQTVGGPIDLAVITKHEGFRWVRRKYYYDRSFNPDA